MQAFEGNYDAWRTMQQVREQVDVAATTAARRGKSESVSSNDHKATETAKRKRKFPYRKAHEIEDEIKSREEAIAQIHRDLASPEILRVGPKVVQLNRELAETSATLEQLYEHWMEALELNG
ncbi:MAG: ABC transporter C-terminal domain-containing protein [Planctomycetota bacterium]